MNVNNCSMFVFDQIETSKRIRDLAEGNGISQREIAKHCGFTVQAVSKWMTGSSAPSLSSLKTLSELFHTPIDEILVYHRKE